MYVEAVVVMRKKVLDLVQINIQFTVIPKSNENSLHSLHDYCNKLIIKKSLCNEGQKQMSLMSLSTRRVTSVACKKQAHCTGRS